MRLYSPLEVAKTKGVSAAAIYYAVRVGLLKPVRRPENGKATLLFAESQVRRYLKVHRGQKAKGGGQTPSVVRGGKGGLCPVPPLLGHRGVRCFSARH